MSFRSVCQGFMFSAVCILGLSLGCAKKAVAPVTVAAAPALAPSKQKAKTPIPPEGIRGIYLTGWSAGNTKRLDHLIELVDKTELNAMVIDVKDDGQVSYDVDVPLAREIHANLKMFRVDKVIAKLKEHHIFVIARIA